MIQNELEITIPKGQEIDWEESAKQKKLILKKKDNKPKSWEEYCHTRLDNKNTRFGYRIGNTCEIITADWDNVFDYSTYKDVLPSKELAKAFLNMMQIMSLRQDWIHKWSIDNGMTYDWNPDWNGNKMHYCIVILDNKYIVERFIRYYHALSFPTEELANNFMNCFKDLLEIAKLLI